MEFKDYLLNQLKLHPSAKPIDIIKQCYQSAFGAEHLLSNLDMAKEYLIKEYNSVDACDGLLYEEISNDISRVNLRVWKYRGYDIDKLFELFVKSLIINNNVSKDMYTYLDIATSVIKENNLSFSYEEWLDILTKYKESGINPVHHSNCYRETEAPAYRIVKTNLLKEYNIGK